MPELPEVECTRRGLAPWLESRHIRALVVRNRRLRWLIPRGLEERLAGTQVTALERRGKYLLMRTRAGTALMHLGMSGRMRVLTADTAPDRHDHFDLLLETVKTDPKSVAGSDICIRFTDPRRFGCLLWAGHDPQTHRLLRDLGPEPLLDEFSGEYLWRKARGRTVAIKLFVMNAAVVVGVGNIYASEALFRARIDPRRATGRISRRDMDELAAAVRAVLGEAIIAGGTTLRDFYNGAGEPGYFGRHLCVYDRADQPCRCCGTPVRHIVQGQRSTYFCPGCQR
jgi:formamidopyrimidine-DNA glycosylase